ncbi:hypothetical protein LguiA_021712 [Lonicera macranthoides]
MIDHGSPPIDRNTFADIEAAYNCLLETYGAKVEDVMMTMRASIRDEVLTELRGGNGPSSIDNVPTSSSIHRLDLDID